jgi:hypothetical protein
LKSNRDNDSNKFTNNNFDNEFYDNNNNREDFDNCKFDKNDELERNQEIYNVFFKELCTCKHEGDVITLMKKNLNIKNKENKFQWLIFKSKLASKMNLVKDKLKFQYHRDMQLFWGRHMIRQSSG